MLVDTTDDKETYNDANAHSSENQAEKLSLQEFKDKELMKLKKWSCITYLIIGTASALLMFFYIRDASIVCIAAFKHDDERYREAKESTY